ncbi:MAG: hypothetical protein J5449_06355 [Oscillospiraceae bacterium]|nr:hypothetical protein [Oscillospiraceae bacterium]
MKRLIERLKSRSGESLTESLIALVIISCASLLLAGAITSAARLNDKLNNKTGSDEGKIVTFSQYQGEPVEEFKTVTLKGSVLGSTLDSDSRPTDGVIVLGYKSESGAELSYTVTLYKDKGDMMYYEKN